MQYDKIYYMLMNDFVPEMKQNRAQKEGAKTRDFIELNLQTDS